MRQFCELRFRPAEGDCPERDLVDYLTGYTDALADGDRRGRAVAED